MNNHFTPTTATVFEAGESLIHTAILSQIAHDKGCSCQPYIDWFTYNRWNAQGFQVQKGEHGIKLTTYVPVTEKKDGKETTYTVPHGTTVFCRCQVKAKEN